MVQSTVTVYKQDGIEFIGIYAIADPRRPQDLETIARIFGNTKPEFAIFFQELHDYVEGRPNLLKSYINKSVGYEYRVDEAIETAESWFEAENLVFHFAIDIDFRFTERLYDFVKMLQRLGHTDAAKILEDILNEYANRLDIDSVYDERYSKIASVF